MSQTSSNSLSEFMKKKINEKSTKKHPKSNFSSKIKKKDEADEMSEEEIKKAKAQKKLRIAKNTSNQKAANYNKFEMYKKMIIQCLLGYLALLSAVTILTLACIMIGPAIMGFFQMILSKLVLASLEI